MIMVYAYNTCKLGNSVIILRIICLRSTVPNNIFRYQNLKSKYQNTFIHQKKHTSAILYINYKVLPPSVSCF